MVELKTLEDFYDLGYKDLGIYITEEDAQTFRDREYQEDIVHCVLTEIKIEAIKWMRELEKKADKKNKKSRYAGVLQFSLPIAWIKHFFNLTDEEIKLWEVKK